VRGVTTPDRQPQWTLKDPLDRVLHALGNPLRRQILQELSRQPASAKMLADKLDEELGMVSYHLNRVLADQCGVVEVCETIQRRGALEKVHTLKKEIWDSRSFGSLIDGSICEWSPLEVDSESWHEICEAKAEFRERVIAAVRAGRARWTAGESQTQKVIMGVAAFPDTSS